MLRSGAGKLQVATVEEAALPLALQMPEAKVMGLVSDRNGEIKALSKQVRAAASEANAVLVGPGMRDDRQSWRVAAQLAKACTGALVLDAGAMGAYEAARPGATILTPHMGEMASLMNSTLAAIEVDRARVAAEFAASSDVVIVLKDGASTFISSPERVTWVHQGGSVGLGTSGSGDVLAGIIAGLAAQGAPIEQAAVWGVALHARAGAALSARCGLTGFLAREIAGEIPALRVGNH